MRRVNMKKGLASILSLILLLSGCSTTPPIDNDTPTGTQTPIQGVELVRNVEVQKDKSILSLLEEQGYKVEDGYTTYPNEDYFYPIYVNKDNKLQTVYLTIKSAKSYDEEKDYIFANKSMNSSPSFIDSIMGIVGGNSSLYTTTESVSMNDGLAGMAPASGANMNYIPYYELPDFNTSEYDNVKESNFLSVKTSPLSTFAADVDTASYTSFRSILRDKLNDYTLYPSESLHDIRIEEMLNYFNYENTEDLIDDKFSISAEIGKTPWNENTQLLVLKIKAKELQKEDYKGSNLVFLIDTSGSMYSVEKLPLLKESMKLLVEELSDKDTVSIVTYSGTSEVLLKGASGSEKNKINKIIDGLTAEGSTNGEGGIRTAYEIAEKYKDKHSNSRIIMCSDGDLNVGISSVDDLQDLIVSYRDKGVYLSVLGFGMGNFSDTRMETLADNGNGNYHYIDSLKEGEKVLSTDLMSTLVTLADDVKFQIEFNPEYIKGYRKIGYENRDLNDEDFSDDTKDGGEVGYGHEVVVVYEIVPTTSEFKINETDLRYQSNEVISTNFTDWMTVSIRYKNVNEENSNLIEYVVDEKNLKDENTFDWNFISNVVAFGLIANESNYINGYELSQVISNLEDMDLSADRDKVEFNALVLGYDYYLQNQGKEDVVENENEW